MQLPLPGNTTRLATRTLPFLRLTPPLIFGACTAQIDWRLSDEPVTADTPAEEADPEFRANARCIIFLGYTSNFTSAGTREQLR